ncbi:FKBP12-interacting protein of 37 kDa-like isoform X2 [Carya illinoinensis]|uniref:FKBP12-interacting protein of 37 kDa-like isoform X2 n=1 Tax=Carya illinoinensis TaxID=32201 RepID=UPI001C721629|nr:FKBP12-interacting protein of 37 kDa-like isoform X2 [Carya illinoinensis]
MAAHTHLDDDDDFGGDFPGTHNTRRSADKRSFGDLEDDEDDVFGSKKIKKNLEETAPGVATGMILSLRESLQNSKDELATCQVDLEAAKVEIQMWHSSFLNESFIPAGISPEPKFVIDYLQTLKSSEESLREQLEKAKKKEAAFIVTFAKREQEIAELRARRLLLDPAIHEEFTRLKNLVEEKEKELKEKQDTISALSFTPQSKMGKMLMAKCRTLQEENEEIGNLASEGKMHELSMQLALQKSQNAELRSQFEGLHKHMEGLTNDVERSNEMVLLLQENLEEKDGDIERLKQELHQKSQIGQIGQIEDEKTDSASNKKAIDETMISDTGS